MKTLNFEQPIPGRKVFINRETGTVIGDGKPFNTTEFVLLKGLAQQEVRSRYTPEELALLKTAEEEVELYAKARDEALKSYMALLQSARSLPVEVGMNGRLLDANADLHAQAGGKLRALLNIVDAASEEEGAARVRWTKVGQQVEAAAHARDGAALEAATRANAEREALEKKTALARAHGGLRAIVDQLLNRERWKV